MIKRPSESFARRAAALLLLAVVLGAPRGALGLDKADFGLEPEARPADAARLAAMRKLGAAAERIRGLKLSSQPPWKLRTRPELYRLMVRAMQEGAAPREIRLGTRVYADFGFWPRDFDVLAAMLDLQSGAVEAFYSSSDREFTDVLEGAPAKKTDPIQQLEDDAKVVHEYTHALQDQCLGLPGLGLASGNDRAKAVRALAEGDATLVMCIYMAGRLAGPAAESNSTLVENIVSRLRQGIADNTDSELFRKYPPVLGKTLVFSYDEGTGFVMAVYKESGWAAVNRCYRTPPVSSEQIMHPAKYLRPVPEDPLEIRLPAGAGRALAGAQLIDTDTFGEFEIKVLLTGFVGATDARRAASGWGGDLYAVYERTAGPAKGELVLGWLSAWDSELDAREFFESYSKALDKKCATARRQLDASGLVLDWRGGPRDARLELRGPAVLSVEGADPAETDRLFKLFWSAERNAPEPRHRE